MRRLRRFEERDGQGVLELVIVLVVIAAAAVSIPAYLNMQARNADKSAQSYLVAGARAADSYRWTSGSYRGLTNIDLVRQMTGAGSTSVVWARRSSYCLAASVRGATWSLRGPYASHPKFRASSDCS